MFQAIGEHHIRADNERSATLAEIVGAFSYALDMTEGQPAGHAIRAGWIGTYMGLAAGLRGEALADCYFACLLKDLGCSSNAARVAELFLGDDRKLKHQFKLIGPEATDFLSFIEATVGQGEDAETRACAIAELTTNAGPILNGFIDTRCNQGARIARRLRFSEAVAAGIASLDEHWDGSGMPRGLTGTDIPLISRIALLAQVADVFFMTGGPDAAIAEVSARRGTWFDPDLVDMFMDLTSEQDFWAELSAPDIEQRLFAMEPAAVRVAIDDDYLDEIAAAFGEVIDAKSSFTSGHSMRVMIFTDHIAEQLGFDPAHRRRLRRAAALHDVGKLGVSNRILDKPGKLDDDEWREMREHAARTEAILSRIGIMRDLAMVAAAHHEKLDGTGYPLGLTALAISIETRIITAADIFDALTADRPYRAAMPVEKAFAIMESEVGSGVDAECLAALRSVVARGMPDRLLPVA
ncbi:MAG: HD domain-containing protein [Sphingopyxis sp.]|nr:HD domain-containing protein [Sphingopyxis sp.]